MSEKVRDRRGFERLLRRSLDGLADEAERAQLMAALDAEPELMQYYIELMQLEAAADVLAREPALGMATRRLRSANWRRRSREWLVSRAAPLAAAVVFMLGGGIWLSQLEPRTIVEDYAEQQKNKVVLVSYSGEGECIVPEVMPGALRLDSGAAVVRLGSGVELSLVGPLSIDIIDGMRVHLMQGEMVANVPPWARGFTVRTPLLEVWDLGTIFGIACRGRQDDVFVFKGSVQVNETSGNAVDLCLVGEGVRAVRGELPRKITTEWAAAEQLFASVAGRQAFAEPAKSLKVVDELHEMWLARYQPKPVEKKQVAKAKPKPKPAKTISTGQLVQADEKSDKAVAALSANKEEREMSAVTNMVAATVAAATLGVANLGMAAVPEVSNVRVVQLEHSRKISIKYNLDAEAIITLEIMTNGVSIGDQHVTRFIESQSGVKPPVNRVVEADDDLEIIWNAGIDWPENEASVQAKVTAWTPDYPPQYCAIDVSAGYSAGANEYPVYYYLSEAGVPNGHQDRLYKTTRILMRRIEATGGDFNMGSPEGESSRSNSDEIQVPVTLTRPYYIAVYQLTQQQWQLVAGNLRSWPSNFKNEDYRLTRPVEKVPYDEVRGGVDSNPTVNWPTTGSYVAPNSFMGRMRTRSGITTFDLPTEAQWEWACRADTWGVLNDGTINLNVVDNRDANLDTLGRYRYNGGYNDEDKDPGTSCSTTNGTAEVGSYLPNKWGLYDMHGNVHEWCLDWFQSTLLGGSDPGGPEQGSLTIRVRRGGAWKDSYAVARSASRNGNSPDAREWSVGFRPVINLP